MFCRWQVSSNVISAQTSIHLSQLHDSSYITGVRDVIVNEYDNIYLFNEQSQNRNIHVLLIRI